MDLRQHETSNGSNQHPKRISLTIEWCVITFTLSSSILKEFSKIDHMLIHKTLKNFKIMEFISNMTPLLKMDIGKMNEI